MSPNQQTWSLTPNYFETQPAWLPDTFNGMTTWAGQNSNYGADIKQEGNQNLTQTPFLSGQLDEMERLERKRERNRLAANKCRLRKLEKISQLDAEVTKLKEETCNLSKVRMKLEKEAKELKEEMKKHQEYGCVFQTVETYDCVYNA